MVDRLKNWAGNLAYAAERIVAPHSVDETQELVAGAREIRALGTGHSFSGVADTRGTLLSTEHLNRIVEVGDASVTVEAGIRYGELAAALDGHGLALANLASLPHISVGGAIATSTHGSGVTNGSLSTAVRALELIRADGSIVRLRRGDDDFDGAVVSLGALGVVARVELDVVPAFELRQYVFENLPWRHVEASLAGGYSVSLFTRWTGDTVDQVWVKTRDALGDAHFDASAATAPRHPLPGADPNNCTEQLGVPGRSSDRLPHFRLGFTPSSGEELQSEYIVAREHAAAAIATVRRLRPLVTPLLQVSEIRTIAADALWLSPFYERQSVAIHFTWKPLATEVAGALPSLETALAPFDPRPHWGKLFLAAPDYPQLAAFRGLRDQLDPLGKFRNAFVDALS
jgi:xylitol oxidase